MLFFLQKNVPTSKALAGKATAKKRPSTTKDHPPSKKSNDLTTKKKAYRPSSQKVEKPSKTVDSPAFVPFVGDDANSPTSINIVATPLDVAELMGDNLAVAKEMKEQPDATDKEGSAFSSHVARVVSQMPLAYRYASLSYGESYYSNIVRTLHVGGRPMSLSNRLAIVIPIRHTHSSPLSDKGKDPVEAAPEAPTTLSNDINRSREAQTGVLQVFSEALRQGIEGCIK